jgi:hypothetical protein
MKIAHAYLVFFVALAAPSLQAQQAVLTAGADGSGPGGSLSFSVGQVDYLFSQSSQGSASQGVQQTYPELEIAVAELVADQPMRLYPNPARGWANLELPLGDYRWRADLFDAQGKLIEAFRPSGGLTPLPFADLASGTYLLRVFRDEVYYGQFRLVATH